MGFSIYGLLVGIAIVLALSVASKLLEMKQENGELVWDGMWWVLLPGLIGARAYHVIDKWDYYRVNLSSIWRIWEGGVGIMGGIVGGVLGLILFSYLHAKRLEKSVEETFFLMADVIVMGVLLAQSLGRWGNYFNQELYGVPTDLPWGIEVEGMSGRYHPIFLYESLLNILLFFVLLAIYRKHERRGSVFGGYLLGYGLIRILLEGLRYESWTYDGLEVGRLVGFVFVIVGILIIRRRRGYIKDKSAKL